MTPAPCYYTYNKVDDVSIGGRKHSEGVCRMTFQSALTESQNSAELKLFVDIEIPTRQSAQALSETFKGATSVMMQVMCPIPLKNVSHCNNQHDISPNVSICLQKNATCQSFHSRFMNGLSVDNTISINMAEGHFALKIRPFPARPRGQTSCG